ncbi:hypothetical protein VPH35_055862 [Triticum aestivum]|uniref:uncharacterized protein isoform X1 n=1 Tax=Triticum aestivum TaxID=4565 RepID=UPI001D02AC58|nr:uncharacterized protein LOC123072473 isoform X1 [Triticum aestivum]
MPPPPPSPAPASPVRQPEAAAATWPRRQRQPTNYNVAVNVLNSLDEPLLITWDGIQQWKNCWQDGMLGSNCGVGCWQVTGLEQRNLMRCSKLRWSWSLTRC